jgi:hypothetical protein
MTRETTTGTYKRGQAVLALWHTFAGPFRGDPVVPSVFARRVGKFIELGVGSDERPGAGTDLLFDLAAVFEIGIALDLQDIGLNQLEVARFIMTYRRPLREALAAIDLTPAQGPPVIMLIRARAATEPVRFTETLPKGFSSEKQITWSSRGSRASASSLKSSGSATASGSSSKSEISLCRWRSICHRCRPRREDANEALFL